MEEILRRYAKNTQKGTHLHSKHNNSQNTRKHQPTRVKRHVRKVKRNAFAKILRDRIQRLGEQIRHKVTHIVAHTRVSIFVGSAEGGPSRRHFGMVILFPERHPGMGDVVEFGVHVQGKALNDLFAQFGVFVEFCSTCMCMCVIVRIEVRMYENRQKW